MKVFTALVLVSTLVAVHGSFLGQLNLFGVKSPAINGVPSSLPSPLSSDSGLSATGQIVQQATQDAGTVVKSVSALDFPSNIGAGAKSPVAAVPPPGPIPPVAAPPAPVPPVAPKPAVAPPVVAGTQGEAETGPAGNSGPSA